MHAATSSTPHDFLLGDATASERRLWMSPVLIGLGTPLVLGLVIAPQFLLGTTSLIVASLIILLIAASGAYALSVLFPGTPGALIVSPQSRTLTVIRYGLLAKARVEIPFSQVARFELANELNREHAATPFLHLHTKAGDVWTIPTDVSKAEIEQLHVLVRPKARAR